MEVGIVGYSQLHVLHVHAVTERSSQSITIAKSGSK